MRKDNYIWNAEYRKDNKLLEQFITENYSDSTMGMEWAVRGYLNCLFDRGIYEGTASVAALQTFAKEKSTRYIVILKERNVGGIDGWNMYALEAEIYDTTNGFNQMITVLEGKLKISEWGLRAVNFTDDEWSQGICGEVILLNNSGDLLNKVKNASKLQCNGEEYLIENIEYGEKWIKVKCNKKLEQCAFPNIITIK